MWLRLALTKKKSNPAWIQKEEESNQAWRQEEKGQYTARRQSKNIKKFINRTQKYSTDKVW